MITPQNHDQLKQSGQLNHSYFYVGNGNSAQSVAASPIVNPTIVPLNCTGLIPIDSTFNVVPFVGGTPPDYRNDDGSSPIINFPFNFCFYGQTWTGLYVNNNGNVSFGLPYGSFTSTGFPSNAYEMIAPFWADADTRAPASGIVYYRVAAHHVVVRWNNVGYYFQHANLVNDFQLVITDGTDPILPVGSNIGISYGDMQWTTGDASSGVGGFGGTPATVGANLGDGINYIQFGQFNAPGTTYNGPFGPPSQVDWLDNKQFFLNVCSLSSGGNIPPIMSCNLVCDTIQLCENDTLLITAQYLSPELGQTTIASATASGTGLTNVNSTPGNIADYSADFVGLPSNIGINTIIVSGTDNGTPSATTTGIIVINVVRAPTASFTSQGVCPGTPMPFSNTSTFTTAPMSSLHWDFGIAAMTNDTSNVDPANYVYNSPGVYAVTLLVTDTNGCRDTAIQNVQVYYLPQVNFTATPTSGCAPLCVNFTDASTVQGSTPAQWQWHFGTGATDTLQNPSYCYNANGWYSVVLTVTSAQGCSYTDSIHNFIDVIPGPQAAFTWTPATVTMADPTVYFSDQSSPTPLQWYWDFGTGSATSTQQDPSFIYPDTGTYQVTLIASGAGGACPDTITENVIVLPELLIWIPNAFTPNGDTKNDWFFPVFSDPAYVNQYNFMVFDRWGNLVFQTHDPVKGWDGYFKDMKVEAGVYVYRIALTGIDGVDHLYVGHINLIR